MADFELSESGAWPGCREIALMGELDLAVSDRLGAVLDRVVGAGEHAFVDLTDCCFIDVSGLTVLVRADERMRRRGRHLLLYGAGGQVRRLFTLTGMTVRETFAPAGTRHARLSSHSVGT